MSRPDPRRVRRQPMARADRLVAVSRGRSQKPRSRHLFTEEGLLNVDVLHFVLERAEAVSEGQVYVAATAIGEDAERVAAGDGPVFLGTTLLTIDLSAAMLSDRVDAALVRRLEEVLTNDVRAHHVIRDRVHREVARLLGPLTPRQMELTRFVRAEGLRVLVDVDIEAPIPATTE